MGAGSVRGQGLACRAQLVGLIVLETAEPAEHTQWTRDSGLDQVARVRPPSIEQEVTDIAILQTYLVAEVSIDLEQAVADKPRGDAERFRVAKSGGTIKKYDELSSEAKLPRKRDRPGLTVGRHPET